MSVNEYRPIFLLEVPGKLLERLLNDRVQQFWEDNNVFQDEQFRFRRSRETQQAIAVAYETISQKIAKRYQVRMVLRDVKSAFDKVWHTGLRVKLARTGLPPRILRIFSSFLEEMTATVRVGIFNTPPCDIKARVPQGAVLSPMMCHR